MIYGVSHPGLFGGESEWLKREENCAIAQEGVAGGRITIVAFGDSYTRLTG
jgi:hypothetical protein